MARKDEDEFDEDELFLYATEEQPSRTRRTRRIERYEEAKTARELALKDKELELERAKKEGEQALKANELAVKEKELDLERARKESAEALPSQQDSSPTPAASNTPLSSLNAQVPKWTEEEPEAWLEEVKVLFDNFNTTESERALVLTKHVEGKAKAALHSLEQSQRGDMAAVHEVIAKAYEITSEKWRQQF
ncbi:meiosis-specific nuclear structural protein 1-like [Macrobrachium rosenbergii]|uniref:meiosis-specific nuclear structural protein 1-like n=1 Tax=Macrobrachium rosenbergii TaxID=79674 RepID=UPI0034D3E7C0